VAYSDYFNALAFQSLRGGLGYIASNGADLEALGQSWIGQDCPNDGASLVASSAKDSKEFRHNECKGSMAQVR
jgi:hypothetical protein